MSIKSTLMKFPQLYFRLLIVRSRLSTLTRGSLVREYLASAEHPRLQIGAGRNHLAGWLNTDFLAKHPQFIYLDVTREFPLPSNAFERVYCEHLIEHVSLQDGETLLAQSFRVLKPGGRIRVETPNLEKICHLYAAKDDPDAQRYVQWQHDEFGDKNYPATICFVLNNLMRNWDHRFLYDAEMLRLALGRAGFADIRQYGWGETEDPAFENISQRKGIGGTEYESLVMEATKPG